MNASTPRAVVAIGGSAGALEPLLRLVSDLPADLDAAVLVVIHMPAQGHSAMDAILSRHAPFAAAFATDGEALAPRTIRIAPPDHHLLVRDDGLVVHRGPRVNNHRPAIDPLFRSVSRSHRARAIGVVLSGALDDGAAGLYAIRTRGGRSLVQAPRDALFPDMPDNAIAIARPDRIVPAQELGAAVAAAVADLPMDRRATMPDQPPPPRLEAPPHTPGPRDVPVGSDDEALAGPSTYSCPSCGGVLWETRDDLPSYRCRIGHAFSAGVLEASQEDVVEEALWTALRSVEEQASLNERLAARARMDGNDLAVERFEMRLRDATLRARQIRELLGETRAQTA